VSRFKAVRRKDVKRKRHQEKIKPIRCEDVELSGDRAAERKECRRKTGSRESADTRNGCQLKNASRPRGGTRVAKNGEAKYILKKSYVFRRISRMYWLRIWHNVCQVFSPGVITLVLWPRFSFYLRRGGVATNGGNIADMAVCKLSILMNFLCCPLKSVFDCSCLCCLVSHRWCGGTAHGLKWANGCVPDGIQIFCHGGDSNPAIPCNE
jgi:hypothetical protein